MQAGRTALLGQTDHGSGDAAGQGLGFRTGSYGHGEVCVFVDDHHDIRQEVMAFIGPQVMFLVFGIIELDVVHQAFGQEFIPGVHLHTEGLQHGGGVLGVLDDGLFLLLLFTVGGKHRQIVVQQLSIGAEFHHLGVHEHEFELRGVLGIEQGGHNHVQAHGLTLLGGTGHQEVRGIGQVEDLHLLGNGVADSYRQLSLAFAEGGVVQKGFERHDGGHVVGHLDAHGIRQGGDSHAPGAQAYADVFLQLLDGGDLHARRGIDFI